MSTNISYDLLGSPILTPPAQPVTIENVNKLMSEGQALLQSKLQLEYEMKLLALENENLKLKMKISQNGSVPETPKYSIQPIRQTMPEKFGGDRNKTRAFLNALNVIFLLDPEYYSTEAKKILCLTQLCVGAAANWCSPFLERPEQFEQALSSYEAFRQCFEATFGIANRDRIAFDKIKTLTQGKGSASHYVAMFRSLAVDLDWNQHSLVSHFEDGLNNEIKKMMVMKEPRQTLEESIQIAVAIDQKLYQLNLDSSRFRSPVPRPAQLPPAPVPRPAQLPPAPIPMDLGNVNNHGPRGPLSEAEKLYRRTNHLCMYCGKPGHIAADHKLAPRKQSAAIDVDVAPLIEY
jgi:hypothetical protein